jgi:tetratricopeptide (TPR) repeat protein
LVFGVRGGRPGLALFLCVLLGLAAPAAASVEAELAFHRGVVAFGEDDYAEAQRQFEIVLKDDPEDTVSLHYLGLIAQKRDDHAGALAWFDRALAIDPEDTEVMLDRGIALMDLGRLPEARTVFDALIAAEPDNSRAHLFAGIAAYRAADYDAAEPLLDKAAELDPSVRAQSRYFAGLSEALRGNLVAAQAAFSDVATQSPGTSLSQSAEGLRRQIEPGPPEEEARRWELSVTTGFEYDTNPTILADFVSPNDDGRFLFLTQGGYDIVDREDSFLSVGASTYLSKHFDEDDVDLQVYGGWIGGGYDLKIAWAGLRYDYSFTFTDLDNPYRHQHRITPSLTFTEGEWGATNFFYQYYNENFLDTKPDGTGYVFDRDGYRHVGGWRQLFFLPEPVSFIGFGGQLERNNKEGGEWDYHGFEVSGGGGLDFDYGIGIVTNYRFIWRDYDNKSVLSKGGTNHRDDRRHIWNFEISKRIGDHWKVTGSSSMTWSNSNVSVYDYDRYIGGLYVTYTF